MSLEFTHRANLLGRGLSVPIAAIISSRLLLLFVVLTVAGLSPFSLPATAVGSPSAAQFEHSSSLAPVEDKYAIGQVYRTQPKPDIATAQWSAVPPKLAGRWKFNKMYDSFTDAFDVEKLSDVPTISKRNMQMVIGLRPEKDKFVWDSEDLNKTKLDKFTQYDIDGRCATSMGDHFLNLLRQRTSLELNTADNTIRKVYLSETIIEFNLDSSDKIEARVSTKWFTPEGEAIAISRSKREYKRTAPFKEVGTLNGVDVKSSFDAFLKRRGKSRGQNQLMN